MERIKFMKRTNERYSDIVRDLGEKFNVDPSSNFNHVAKNLIHEMRLLHGLNGSDNFRVYLHSLKALKIYIRLIRKKKEFREAEVSSIDGYFSYLYQLDNDGDSPYASNPRLYVQYAKENL